MTVRSPRLHASESKARIPRHRHRHGHPRDDPREDVGEDVGVDVVECGLNVLTN